MSKSFVKNYISDLIKQIKKDSRKQKFQYKDMDPRDVNFQVDKLKEMKKDQKIIEALANDWNFPNPP